MENKFTLINFLQFFPVFAFVCVTHQSTRRTITAAVTVTVTHPFHLIPRPLPTDLKYSLATDPAELLQHDEYKSAKSIIICMPKTLYPELGSRVTRGAPAMQRNFFVSWTDSAKEMNQQSETFLIYLRFGNRLLVEVAVATSVGAMYRGEGKIQITSIIDEFVVVWHKCHSPRNRLPILPDTNTRRVRKQSLAHQACTGAVKVTHCKPKGGASFRGIKNGHRGHLVRF